MYYIIFESGIINEDLKEVDIFIDSCFAGKWLEPLKHFIDMGPRINVYCAVS